MITMSLLRHETIVSDMRELFSFDASFSGFDDPQDIEGLDIRSVDISDVDYFTLASIEKLGPNFSIPDLVSEVENGFRAISGDSYNIDIDFIDTRDGVVFAIASECVA